MHSDINGWPEATECTNKSKLKWNCLKEMLNLNKESWINSLAPPKGCFCYGCNGHGCNEFMDIMNAPFLNSKCVYVTHKCQNGQSQGYNE